VLLLALPVTFLYQLSGGDQAEAVIHMALALGAGLMSSAAFDFRTSRWIAWIGGGATGTLAAIFLLQGTSELIAAPGLRRVVYQGLGQRFEGWLVDLFLVWCVAVLLMDSQGRTRAAGIVALALAVGVEVYANGLALAGTSLNEVAPGLKLTVLLPIGWLLLESRKTRQRVGARALPI
jgi:hypothetical protein